MATDIVYATGDGMVESSSGTYATARAGTGTLTLDPDGSGTAWVGQAITYFCEQYFAQFDTSVAGTDIVSAVTLSLYGLTDHSTQDFTLQARIWDYGGTVETTDFRAGATLASLQIMATFATSGGFSTVAYNDFTDVAFPASINRSGNTRIIIASDRQAGNNTPVGDEDVRFYTSAQAGTANDPKLTVVHAAASPVPWLPRPRANLRAVTRASVW